MRRTGKAREACLGPPAGGPPRGPPRTQRPSRGLHTLAAAASRDADTPRMATHAVTATSASPTAGGRLAVASAERIRDAAELCEWAAARACGPCTLVTSASAGRLKRRRARPKPLLRAPAQHFFLARAETVSGCGHARADGAPARAPTLPARSALRCKGEDRKQQERRYQLGRRSHPTPPSVRTTGQMAYSKRACDRANGSQRGDQPRTDVPSASAT